MEQAEDIIRDLQAVTRALASAPGPEYSRLLQRRGDLITGLCKSMAFDPGDPRIAAIVLEGSELLTRARLRGDSLRAEMNNLERLSSLIRGLKAAVAVRGGPKVNVTA